MAGGPGLCVTTLYAELPSQETSIDTRNRIYLRETYDVGTIDRRDFDFALSEGTNDSYKYLRRSCGVVVAYIAPY